MKARITSIVGLALWLAHAPPSVRADDIPEKYRVTVRKGLDHLVTKQCPDGHWEGGGGQRPVAMTGLVGVALFMDRGRHDPISKSRRAAEIHKAAAWLMSKSQPSGLIYSGHDSESARYLHGHAFATIFLAGVGPQ